MKSSGIFGELTEEMNIHKPRSYLADLPFLNAFAARSSIERIANNLETAFDRFLSYFFLPYYRVSLVIPAKNEGKYISKVIQAGQKADIVDNIVVVDGFSTDNTCKISKTLGASVVMQEKGLKGKGGAIQTAINKVRSSIYVFSDADILNPHPKMITSLVKPILNDEADHVVARFSQNTGRVTHLTAKPLLDIYFPEIKYQRPLSGLYAVTEKAIRSIKIEENWGVEIARIIDLHMKGFRTKEVNIGPLLDDSSKTVKDLVPMAKDVALTITRKALEYKRTPSEKIVKEMMK